MMFSDALFARRGGGIARLIQNAIDGDPISLAILGIIALVVAIFIGVKIYNAFRTPDLRPPDEELSDEALSEEEKAMMEKFKS